MPTSMAKIEINKQNWCQIKNDPHGQTQLILSNYVKSLTKIQV